jgi:hypothetical protein
VEILGGEKPPDYLTVVDRLKECLDATKERGKVELVKDKEKRNGSKGPSQNSKYTHREKGHNSTEH